MPPFDPSQYDFLGFEKSGRRTKKYAGVLLNKRTNRKVKLHFGEKGFDQFKDRTGLGLYSKDDHNDRRRMLSYQARHKGEGLPSKKYSPGWFSYHFMWSDKDKPNL